MFLSMKHKQLKHILKTQCVIQLIILSYAFTIHVKVPIENIAG